MVLSLVVPPSQQAPSTVAGWCQWCPASWRIWSDSLQSQWTRARCPGCGTAAGGGPSRCCWAADPPWTGWSLRGSPSHRCPSLPVGQKLGVNHADDWTNAKPHKKLLKKNTYLKWDFIKVQPVAHVVICADSLWVVVYHDGFVTHLEDMRHISVSPTIILGGAPPPWRSS